MKTSWHYQVLLSRETIGPVTHMTIRRLAWTTMINSRDLTFRSFFCIQQTEREREDFICHDMWKKTGQTNKKKITKQSDQNFSYTEYKLRKILKPLRFRLYVEGFIRTVQANQNLLDFPCIEEGIPEGIALRGRISLCRNLVRSGLRIFPVKWITSWILRQ